MTIFGFFNKTVIVKRLKTDSGYKESLSTTATVDCSIQSDLSNINQQVEGVQSRRWLGFFDIESDIQEQDILRETVEQKDYQVTEIRKVDFGSQQHLEVVLEEYNA